MKTLVIGASRGLGLEFVRQERAAGHAVTGTARDDDALERLRALGATAIALDVSSAESCSRLGRQLDGQAFDVAVLNAGVYGPKLDAMEAPGESDFDAVMHVNVLGAMRLLPVMAEALAPGGKLAVLSSVMASVGGRTSSSGWLYRASKAALNSVLKDAALVLQDRAVCVALHPGWVRTDMGGPAASLSVQESVAAQRRVLAGLTARDHGGFLDPQGQTIPW
jgi:NAD(P)-dependent dehydrogenase (short-subunit alcohol dehydrogenase family)